MKKEIEITLPLELNESQIVSLDTHSFLNIMNVLSFELFQFGELIGEEDKMDAVIDRVIHISKTLSNPQQAYQYIRQCPQEVAAIQDAVNSPLASHPALKENAAVAESLANMQSIFAILRQRIDEIIQRADAPTAWQHYSITALAENYTNVLGAIEKNSKGRFRIIYNIAAQQPKDYYVDFKIQSYLQDMIEMPPVFIDVMRDLIANARKYTEPGGRINAGIWSDPQELVLSVEDSGCGIPPDEIENVVGFGLRGSNVSEQRTMGAGIGLTKAYYLTKKMQGRMWISSEPGQGTRIKITLPRPQQQN